MTTAKRVAIEQEIRNKFADEIKMINSNQDIKNSGSARKSRLLFVTLY